MGNGASTKKGQIAVTNLQGEETQNNELDAPVQPTVQIKKAKPRKVEVKAAETPTPIRGGEIEPDGLQLFAAPAAETEVTPTPAAEKLAGNKSASSDLLTKHLSPRVNEYLAPESPITEHKPVPEKSPQQPIPRRLSEDQNQEVKMSTDDIVTEPMTEQEGEDMEPVDILLQFIPYYGQGDPGHDSIVRAALSGLSVEDIDSKDEYGNTLLLLACQYRCEDLVRIMLNKGADPNAVNSSGACCLHFTCYKESQSFPIAKILLQNGANPEVAETTYGCTPLHYCAGTGDVNFCKLLLSHGAQINTADFYTYTCVDYAREANMPDCVRYLQERLDKFNMQSQIRPFPGSPTGNRQGGGAGGFFDSPNNYYNPMMNMMGMASMGMNNMGGMPGMGGGFNMNEWQPTVDQNSGMKFYTNNRTGECIWEQDFKMRAQAASMFPQFGMGQFGGGVPPMIGVQYPQMSQSSMLGGGGGPPPSQGGILSSGPPPSSTLPGSGGGGGSGGQPSQLLDQIVTQKAARGRVTELLKKHAPERLSEVDELLGRYKGQEETMITDLCSQYKITGTETGDEVKAFRSALTDLKSSDKKSAPPPGGAGVNQLTIDTQSVDGPPQNRKASLGRMPSFSPGTTAVMAATPTAPPPAAAAAAQVIVQGISEQVVQAMMLELRAKHEAQLEEERVNFRSTVSEKEGVISKIQSEVEALAREKNSAKEEMFSMQEKLNRLQMQGGEAQNKSEEEIARLTEANNTLRTELNSLRQQLAMETEKSTSMETMISNMTSGHDEAIAREKAAADERARQQQQREEQFARELREVEDQRKNAVAKAKDELMKTKADFARHEASMQSEFDSVKKAKDKEIDTLHRELADLKARSAQELSAAQMQIEDLKRAVDEMTRRAEGAEAMQRVMQEEINEARIVQQYNAQLHKDLAREQLARKRLHNEMEDMKGKIRVYVRIRPFTQSERDRGCTEAVIKDGKISCLVRTGDQKKNYDFDQVFGGPDGNSQTDIFRDTKHLMMSVVDGYNVCIFAYGQTGAGKSFTMIGAADIGTCMNESGEFEELAGITPRAVSELFRLLNERSAQISFSVEVQMFQLYRDSLEDLLIDRSGGKNKKSKKGGGGGGSSDVEEAGGGGPLKITLAEHSATGLVQVEGACIMSAQTPGDVMRIFARGSAMRTTASTQMNAESSRSHLICSLVVKLTNRRTGSESIGKLTLVDLAGSERVDKSGAAGEVLKEAQSINKSLSALGDVISALTSGQAHVPYRNHPLTMLMSDSLGGNSKTLMFVNCSPADYNSPESNSSLSFASRCRNVTNAVATGPGVQAAQMMALKKELAKLKKQGGGAAGGTLSRPI